MKKSLIGVSALALFLTASPVLAAEISVEADNVKTGADSDNFNTVTTGSNRNNVDIDNTGDVDNVLSGNANTGRNTQTRNTGTSGAGDPDTGNINASTDWANVVNAMGDSLCDCLLAGSDMDITADFLNELTGDTSDNFNTLTVNNSGNVDIDNTANIDNVLSLVANTGENHQSRNTAVGEIQTGDVGVDSVITNEANSSTGNGSLANGGSVTMTATNMQTGADSDNRNTTTVNNGGSVKVDNTANVNNRTAVTANTGRNTQTRNTKAGDITTGDVSVSQDVVTSANSGDVCCVVGGRQTDVTVDAENRKTGSNSDNRNTVAVNNSGSTDIDNNADVDNVLSVNANTGDNHQDRNTEAGEIKTGDVNIEFDVTNEVNSSN